MKLIRMTFLVHRSNSGRMPFLTPPVTFLGVGGTHWTQGLRKILRMVIINTVINTLLGRLTLDLAGMHCPSWDDAFVSSSVFC